MNHSFAISRGKKHNHSPRLIKRERKRKRAAKKASETREQKRCERKQLKTNPCTSCLSQGNHSGILRYLYIVLSHEFRHASNNKNHATSRRMFQHARSRTLYVHTLSRPRAHTHRAQTDTSLFSFHKNCVHNQVQNSKRQKGGRNQTHRHTHFIHFSETRIHIKNIAIK